MLAGVVRRASLDWLRTGSPGLCAGPSRMGLESGKGGWLVALELRRVNGGVRGLALGRNRHDG